MEKKFSSEEKRIIAAKYHRRLIASNIMNALALLLVLISVSSLDKLSDMFFKLIMYSGFGLLILAFVYKIALSSCPFCQHKLYNPGRRREFYAMPTECPKCGEKLK